MDLIAKLVAETATELNKKAIKEIAELKSRLKVIEIINDSEIKNETIAVMCDLSKPIVADERWEEVLKNDN